MLPWPVATPLGSLLRSIATDVTTSSAANSTSSTVPGSREPTRPPPYAPAMPEAPNSIAVRHRTRPARAWETAPSALVTATTSSDVAIAS